MRNLLLLILLTLIPINLLAQDNPREFEIVKSSWHGAKFDGTINQFDGAFSVDIKNTGSHAIIAVDWDFYLIDTVRRRLFDRFKFTTDDKTIEPGKTVKLIKRFNYAKTPNYVTAKVVVWHIKYSDGSEWNSKLPRD